MNWPFWSLSRTTHSESCESIEPLLSLYADGMASPEEVRRVESHLPGCDDCREALSWMQATHRTLAARPIVDPPANLHSRIALAIAASSAAPISLRPARTFTLLRPYAAAASLTALGLVLSYSLLHSPTHSAKQPLPKPAIIATAPNIIHVPNTFKAHLPHPMGLKPARSQVADSTRSSESAKQNAVEHAQIVIKQPVKELTPHNKVAAIVPDVHSTLPVIKAPVRSVKPHTLVATNKIAPVDKHLPAPIKENVTPRMADPTKVADRTQPPAPVPVHILPSTVTVQPEVQTASTNTAPPTKLDGILGSVNAYFKGKKPTALQPIAISYQRAATAMQSLDSEHAAHVYNPIYTP